jgi:hypothetical protein
MVNLGVQLADIREVHSQQRPFSNALVFVDAHNWKPTEKGRYSTLAPNRYTSTEESMWLPTANFAAEIYDSILLFPISTLKK